MGYLYLSLNLLPGNIKLSFRDAFKAQQASSREALQKHIYSTCCSLIYISKWKINPQPSIQKEAEALYFHQEKPLSQADLLAGHNPSLSFPHTCSQHVHPSIPEKEKALNTNFHDLPFKELHGYRPHLSKSYALTRLSLNARLQLPEGALYKLLLTD